MFKTFKVGDHLTARPEHFAPIAVGSEIYRHIFYVYNEEDKLAKDYEIWVSETYIADLNQLLLPPTKNQIYEFSQKYLINRYKVEKGHPQEKGVYLTNQTGEYRGDPAVFSLMTKDVRKLVTTAVMLPQSTLDWLKNYGEDKSVSVGEAVRRIVGEYSAGTVSTQQVENKPVVSTAGAITQNEQ